MPFIKKNKIDFFIKDNQIILSEEYKNKMSSRFKKITGSRFYSVLGFNEMNSEFKTWCMMVNIYYEKMDPILANAGNIIEPKIRKWVENKLNIKYKIYDPIEENFDIFKNNKIFGGIPDGEPLIDNQINYSKFGILEIKTTSIDNFLYKKIDHVFVLQKDEQNKPIIKSKNTKKEKWFNNNGEIIIPNEYKFQLGLYCYLRNINKGLFAICFLETQDYINPVECDVNNREIQIINFSINLNEFKKYIKQSEEWYNKYILSGISPKMNSDDKQFVKDLLNYEQ